MVRLVISAASSSSLLQLFYRFSYELIMTCGIQFCLQRGVETVVRTPVPDIAFGLVAIFCSSYISVTSFGISCSSTQIALLRLAQQNESVHFARETRSVLCQIASWDCFQSHITLREKYLSSVILKHLQTLAPLISVSFESTQHEELIVLH